MKAKYIEEQFPEWFLEGGALMIGYNTSHEKDCSYLNDEELKTALIAEHNRTVQKLVDVALAWANDDSAAFTKYWYPN